MPPPAPYRNGTLWTQVFPDLDHFEVPQPVSSAMLPPAAIPREVPPTAVAQGLAAGRSADFVPARLAASSPSSPEEKRTEIPVAAACMNMLLSACAAAALTDSSGSPQELVMTSTPSSMAG